MDFNIVLTKHRKKFDKFSKINKLKNKEIIDISNIILSENLCIMKDREYINTLIHLKIIDSFKRNRDIYYIPDFSNKDVLVSNLVTLKKSINLPNINVIMFFDDFIEDDNFITDFFNNVCNFDRLQILKDF